MDDTGRLAETLAYVELQRLQSYAAAVTRRAWSELAGLVRADCPIVVDVRHKKFELTGPAEYGEFHRPPDRALLALRVSSCSTR